MQLSPHPWQLDRPNAGHLLLIGPRGAGKTFVGQALAQRLGLQFHDTDAWIVEKSGLTIAEWFATRGEPAFRDEETLAIRKLSNEKPGVLALGGGAVERMENQPLIRTVGYVIGLDAPAEVLLERIQNDSMSDSSRPALTELGSLGEIHELLRRRGPMYDSLADLRMNTQDKSVNQVVDEIVSRLPR